MDDEQRRSGSQPQRGRWGALAVALIGVAGCGLPASDPGEPAELASALTERDLPPAEDLLDPAPALAIARAKLAAAAQTTAAAAPFEAACGRPGVSPLRDLVPDAALHGAARQRSGSSTGCPTVGVLQPSDDALYFCYTLAAGFTWTFNRNLRTGVEGWTRDDLLDQGGSHRRCGF